MPITCVFLEVAQSGSELISVIDAVISRKEDQDLLLFLFAHFNTILETHREQFCQKNKVLPLWGINGIEMDKRPCSSLANHSTGIKIILDALDSCSMQKCVPV